MQWTKPEHTCPLTNTRNAHTNTRAHTHTPVHSLLRVYGHSLHNFACRTSTPMHSCLAPYSLLNPSHKCIPACRPRYRIVVHITFKPSHIHTHTHTHTNTHTLSITQRAKCICRCCASPSTTTPIVGSPSRGPYGTQQHPRTSLTLKPSLTHTHTHTHTRSLSSIQRAKHTCSCCPSPSTTTPIVGSPCRGPYGTQQHPRTSLTLKPSHTHTHTHTRTLSSIQRAKHTCRCCASPSTTIPTVGSPCSGT